MVAKKSALPFHTCKTLVKEMFKSFPKLWWRIGAVNILTALCIIFSSAVILGIAFLAFRDTLEGIIANLQFGGRILPQIWVLAGLTVVWILGVIIFSVMGKIALWLTLQNYTEKKTKNPFSIYFLQSWKYFWRYLLMGLKILWYVIWPILLIVAVGSAISRFTSELPILISFIIAGGLFLWRIINVLLATPILVHFDTSVSKAFKASLHMVRKNWWRVFLVFVAVFILLNVIRALFFVPDFVMSFGWNMSPEIWTDYMSQHPTVYHPTWLLAVDGLFSFFILAPLLITFLYLLMLHLSKATKVKP